MDMTFFYILSKNKFYSIVCKYKFHPVEYQEEQTIIHFIVIISCGWYIIIITK